jgi:hypothetical protein
VLEFRTVEINPRFNPFHCFTDFFSDPALLELELADIDFSPVDSLSTPSSRLRHAAPRSMPGDGSHVSALQDES